MSGPKNEPEVSLANARLFIETINANAGKPHGATIYVARELGEQAHAAFAMLYQFGFSVYGLSEMAEHPPSRFTWFVDDKERDATESLKCRDNETGQVITWPHWWG